MRIYFIKLKTNAFLPTKEFGDDAGYDLYSNESVVIPPKSHAIISTGIGWGVKRSLLDVVFGFNVVGIVKARSGLCFKQDIDVANAGVIDAGYRGEIKIKVYNDGDFPFTVEYGHKIAQILPVIILKEHFDKYTKQKHKKRNEKGFGSTGFFKKE